VFALNAAKRLRNIMAKKKKKRNEFWRDPANLIYKDQKIIVYANEINPMTVPSDTPSTWEYAILLEDGKFVLLKDGLCQGIYG
jgi:hypothetical protein